MNINLSSFSIYALSFFREGALPALTTQQKKILVVASVAFSCLTALYLLNLHCFFKAKPNPKKENEANEAKMKAEKEANEAKLKAEKDAEKAKLKAEKEERIYPDGTVARGKFKNDELNGQGKKTLSNGTVFKGEFKDGWLVKGKITWHNEGVITSIAEGEFQNNRLHGQGKRTFPSGEIHQGEFQNNRLHGQGKMTLPKTKVYSCSKPAEYHSEVREGEFKEGWLNGQGKITHPDGTVVEGIFEKDFLIKPKL